MKTAHKKASRAKRQYRADPSAGMNVIALHQEPHEPMVIHIVKQLRACFDHMREGGSDWHHFNKLSGAVNVGLVRAEAIEFGSDAVATMERAVTAMENAAGRRTKVGHFGFTSLELVDMDLALDLYAQILALSTPVLMLQAGKIAQARHDRLVAARAKAAGAAS